MQWPASREQRRALGDFLRARRERLTPSGFGLAAGSRRRTPGLRREEVAQLCGMSATWYTWIEQGRDVSASPAALARLAQAIRLTPAERAYLFELAGKRDPSGRRADDRAGDAPAALVDAVHAFAAPAYLLDRGWHARAWNPAAAKLFVGWLDHGGTPNLLRYIFLEPAARSLIRDWRERARRVLAEFRADCGRHLDDPALGALIDELERGSAAFARWWREHSVTGREGGERSFDHPRHGLVRYRQTTLIPATRPDFKLVVLTPIAAPARDRLTRRRRGRA